MMAGRRVLVVDDEADLLATYERLLRREALAVTAAASLAGALAALERDHPDLVITDLKLPDGDGLVLVRAASGERRGRPVIVVTGFPSDETRRAALAAGAVAFLPKPFGTSALLAAVRSSLDAAPMA